MINKRKKQTLTGVLPTTWCAVTTKKIGHFNYFKFQPFAGFKIPCSCANYRVSQKRHPFSNSSKVNTFYFFYIIIIIQLFQEHFLF